MRVFLFLKQGLLDLAKEEAESLAESVEDHGAFVIAEFKDTSFERLVLTRFAGELIDEVSSADEFEYECDSFAVRCTSMGKASASKTERDFGSRIKGIVDLENPGTIIRVFAAEETFFVTKQLFEYSEKEFLCRRVNARPYHHPTSLQPWWGRLLLNLSGVKDGTVLDPFCGAGGIILEAGMLGIKGVGVDKDESVVEGARENLWFFHADECVIEHADFLEWEGNKFDAIVTDLPYGRSSQLFGEELHGLYSKAFEKMLTHSKKAVVMGPEDLSELLEESGWRVASVFDFYVHKSLRRWIHVCERIKSLKE